MGRGKRMLGTPRPASEKTPGHREERARALAVGTLVTPRQVAIIWGKLEVGGASRDPTGFGALAEGLISS